MGDFGEAQFRGLSEIRVFYRGREGLYTPAINLPEGMGDRRWVGEHVHRIAMQHNSGSTDGETELPTDFAEHAAEVTGLDAVPATLEEWWTSLADQYSENDIEVGLRHLYSDSPTRHEVHVDGRIRYAGCVLDALQAAVFEEQDTVTVRSIDPVAATPVTIAISDESVQVSPEGALISFGSSLSAEDVEAVGSLAAWSVKANDAEIQASVCQYTNAFEREATYEEWVSVTDCVSAPLPPASVVPLLRELPQEGN